MDFLNTIFQAIISPELQRALLPIKILLLVFSFLLLCAIVWFLSKTTYLNLMYLQGWREYSQWQKKVKAKKKELSQKEEKKKINQFSEEEIEAAPGQRQPPPADGLSPREIQAKEERSDWQRVLDKLQTDNELNWKLALIDASKMLDKILAEQGKGLVSENVSNAEEINKAKHYLERVLENPEASIDLKDAKKIIGIHEKALRELGAIKE